MTWSTTKTSVFPDSNSVDTHAVAPVHFYVVIMCSEFMNSSQFILCHKINCQRDTLLNVLLTMSGPALDGDRALISSKGIVEQVHFTVHPCIYDHGVFHSAITVHQQVMGAVLHGCLYPTKVRDNKCIRRMSRSWWQAVWSRLTHWSRGALGSTLCLPVGSLHHTHRPTCSMPAQNRATSVGQNQKWKWLKSTCCLSI